MKNKKIIYRIGQDYQHRMRFGEVSELIRACYFHGKTLGYEDNNIYLEWPYKVAYNPLYREGVFYPCPRYSILPIQFVKKEDFKPYDYDEIKDLLKPNLFYDGSIPLYVDMIVDGVVRHKKSYSCFWNFFNKYYSETGKKPIFDIPKDVLNKKYILFHIRIANWNETRNPDLNIYHKIIKLIQEKYGDKYEYWKCGEPCRGIDRLFDKVMPYTTDLNVFMKLLNNASVMVCCASGPDAYAWGLGTPILHIESLREGKGQSKYFDEAYWKEINGIYGKTQFDWLERDKLCVLYKGEEINENQIYSFMERFL